MRKRAWALVVLPLLLGACQSYEKGIEVICQAPNTCQECANADPSMRMPMLAHAIEEGLSNGKATDLFAALAALTPEQRAATLAAEAKAAGLAGCPLADEFRQAAAAP